jgi:uncharacterized protein (DUF1800 family)
VSGESDGREQVTEEACAALLTEMAALRDFPVPAADEDPREVHRLLREDLRSRLDRAEVLMAQMARYRRRARRGAARLKAEADDAYDTELAELAKKAVRLEYQSVHDRIAMAKVASSPQRREARAAERLADRVDEAEEVMKGMFFGLRDVRRELLATLEKFLPFESSLER